MPVILDGAMIGDGDTVKVGEKQYELNEDSDLVMEVALPFRNVYALAALLERKAVLEADLVEVDALIAKHAELS
jgi:hypothetical protein